MKKRRSCVLNVVKPSKTPRTEGKTCVDEDEIDEEEEAQQDHPLSSSVRAIFQLEKNMKILGYNVILLGRRISLSFCLKSILYMIVSDYCKSFDIGV